jgi:hypothetical protein
VLPWATVARFHMVSHGHFDENGYYACALHPEGPWCDAARTSRPLTFQKSRRPTLQLAYFRKY